MYIFVETNIKKLLIINHQCFWLCFLGYKGHVTTFRNPDWLISLLLMTFLKEHKKVFATYPGIHQICLVMIYQLVSLLVEYVIVYCSCGQDHDFRSRDIQIFVFFPLPFHTFQTQKDKWRWNNL